MKSEDKPILIIFEGVDKSGKTTLKDTFNRFTNFKYVVLDRLTTSSKIYAKYFGRDGVEYYKGFERKILENFNVLVVCCVCDTGVIEDRLDKAGEALPWPLRNIEAVQNDFVKEVKSSFANHLIVNTSEHDVNECVLDIFLKVQSMEVEDRGAGKNCI